MNHDAHPWCYILHINHDANLDELWLLLKESGIQPLYVEEDPEELAKIYVQADTAPSVDELLERFAFIEYIEQKELGEIDWDAQWKAHGLNFHEGYVHIDLPEAVKNDWKQVKLLPGAGFGDLSHPTTRLILKMMKAVINQHAVVDIGCGSGVLALCAVALGAKHVYAIDIDEQALKHAKENAVLNQMESSISFYSPSEFVWSEQLERPVILMNMIRAEQEEAWEGLPSLHHHHAHCLTSGILTEQKNSYLEWVRQWGWKAVNEQEEQGWLAIEFQPAED